MTSSIPKLADDPEVIEVIGASEHNLKNIDVTFPRNQLVVITGLSGSGKSSLAFDTIFAEGQRRYIESFSAYARQFLGNLAKPKVERISGLSPAIAIEQKTTSKSPRSTVGTITEIYDFLRLLYARVGTAYSYETGEEMVGYSNSEIFNKITATHQNQAVMILSPLVRGRKGHYRELFERLGKQGFAKVRVDGELVDMVKGFQVDRYKVHDIELVVDRLKVTEANRDRLKSAIDQALKMGGNTCMSLGEEGDSFFYSQDLTCPTTGLSYPAPEPNLFSFNSPYGACSKCKGLGFRYELDLDKIIPAKEVSIKKGAILPLGKFKSNYIFNAIERLAEEYSEYISKPYKLHSDEFVQALLFGEDTEGSHSFSGLFELLNQQSEYEGNRRIVNHYSKEVSCSTCEGQRLNRPALHFRIAGKNIAEVAKLDIAELSLWCDAVLSDVKAEHQVIAQEILKEVKDKVGFLLEVGLYYLSLDRTAKTLSGGESQRIRLASQIGAKLVGVLYILDEPSIGLHPNDNRKMIGALRQLVENGNSVLVVEHDKEIMEKCDYLIDVGPRAGINGGQIVDQGPPHQLKNKNSLTYQYLKGVSGVETPTTRRQGNGEHLILKGATGHNLKNVNLDIPLGTFVAVSGVSGSGKSSLIDGTLSPVLFNHVYQSSQVPLPYQSIEGLEEIDKIIEIDQSPIGRTPRSNPATYTGLFSDIRNLFANLPQAKILGLKPGKFSFNVAGGRCEDCKGAGVQVIEMNFLPDVAVTCKVCNGKRYKKEILKVRYKGKNIYDVLEMSIGEAVDFFQSFPSMYRKLKVLDEVGLSYIKLGQSSLTLSGGEAQRIKLGSELHKKDTGKTLYLLDEPTTGLHFEDIKMLLKVMNQMVERGNTVLVIEHNTDILKSADYIVDLGVEGGSKGGQIVATGTPEQVAKNKRSLTGKFLKEELNL